MLFLMNIYSYLHVYGFCHADVYLLFFFLFLSLSGCVKADMRVTQKSFNFAKKQGLPFYFVSAADGTNVVKVRFLDPFKVVLIHFL